MSPPALARTPNPSPHHPPAFLNNSPPMQRPPSRSERLLMDTLRRDATTPPQPHKHHRRRHSSPTKPSSNSHHDADYTTGTFLFRSSITPNSHTGLVSRSKRAETDACKGDTEYSCAYTYTYASPAASPTPSPTKPRHDHSSGSCGCASIASRKERLLDNGTPGPGLTPHEQVLRARLERVLRCAANAENRAPSKSSKRSSASEEDGENDASWLWRDVFAPHSASHHPSNHRTTAAATTPPMPGRSQTDPCKASEPDMSIMWTAETPLSAPLTPSTTRRSTSRSHHSYGKSRTRPSSSSHSDRDDRDDHFHLDLKQQHEFLTPPPTPPLGSDTNSPPPSPPLQASGPPTPSHLFNARTASVQCRQMEGYVSFAAIEGLGEPPGCNGIEDEGEDETAAANARKEGKGRLGIGLGKIWKVLGEVGGK
jgi:hypothetical protein